MAVLLLISTDQINEPYNYEDDVIEVFEDDHQFTPNELEVFEFLTVNGSKADVEAKLNQLKPVIGVALMGTDGKWTFDRGEPITGEEMEVWTNMLNPIRWYEYVVPFKYVANIGTLTAEQKQLLATIDINHPSVDSAIRTVLKDLSVNPANNEVVKELQGDVWG